MILITGASGKTGRALIQKLVQKRTVVRAFVHHKSQQAELLALGASEAVVGDLRNASDLARACQGIETLYHICPNMQPDEVAIAQLVLAAAQAQGVSRFVYHSVLHPQTEEMPHHWHKLRVEELLFKSSLDYTILQPAAYMQNILVNWETIVNQGIYRVPYGPETRLGMVDLADVAESAAIVLTEEGHSGAIYELANSEVLSQTEVAAIIAQQIGRSVVVEEMARIVWVQNTKAVGLETYAVETLLKMFDYYECYGFWGNANLLQMLLGRAPTSFEAFVKRMVAVTPSR